MVHHVAETNSDVLILTKTNQAVVVIGDIHVDIAQPTVRFNKFNDSSLDFAIIVFMLVRL